MSGLMLVFLFIAIGFMIEVESDKQKMEDVTATYRDTKANLNEILYAEFEKDLQIWNAVITKSTTTEKQQANFKKSEEKQESKNFRPSYFSV